MLPAKIYLDYNATIAVKPAVIARMVEVMASPFNASSIHTTGREASRLLEEARRQVANAMGASYARVIFTASGTEANNLAANGIKGYVLAVSSIEHVSMLRAKDDAMIIPVNKQ